MVFYTLTSTESGRSGRIDGGLNEPVRDRFKDWVAVPYIILSTKFGDANPHQKLLSLSTGGTVLSQ